MTHYTILGLNVEERIGHTYETDSDGRILHDEEGKGISKTRNFNNYIIYACSDNLYYAIYLSESNGASFGGRIYSIGEIKIEALSDPPRDFTHCPVCPLRIQMDLEREYDFGEEIHIYLQDDPLTYVFRFSSIGSGDECVPDGYVMVNMDLFESMNPRTRNNDTD